jgi:UDP:flavonoid glycosyltransferase YjiC (YdhE family)
MVTPPQGDPPEWLAAIRPDQPLGLVTLGSTFTGDLNFFALGARAVAEADMIPVVVLGPTAAAPAQKERLKANLPGGTRLLSWIDYDHVFPRLKVIIHHGGMGTTHAAIVHAVPQIIVPHAADQRGQARRAHRPRSAGTVAARGAPGAACPGGESDPTTDWVLDAVQQLARDFAELGGPSRAAELLVEIAGG